MQITDELIKHGQSKHGGWSRSQLALLGISWPPKRGWRKRALGRAILPQAAAEFVALKNAHKKQSEEERAVAVHRALDAEFDAIFRH